jgi:hypothetical protein
MNLLGLLLGNQEEFFRRERDRFQESCKKYYHMAKQAHEFIKEKGLTAEYWAWLDESETKRDMAKTGSVMEVELEVKHDID